MRYFKLVTSDQESRWLNLAQISRVTYVPGDDGRTEPIVAIYFADASNDAKLEIRGTSSQNCAAIKQLTEALDVLADS